MLTGTVSFSGFRRLTPRESGSSQHLQENPQLLGKYLQVYGIPPEALIKNDKPIEYYKQWSLVNRKIYDRSVEVLHYFLRHDQAYHQLSDEKPPPTYYSSDQPAVEHKSPKQEKTDALLAAVLDNYPVAPLQWMGEAGVLGSYLPENLGRVIRERQVGLMLYLSPQPGVNLASSAKSVLKLEMDDVHVPLRPAVRWQIYREFLKHVAQKTDLPGEPAQVSWAAIENHFGNMTVEDISRLSERLNLQPDFRLKELLSLPSGSRSVFHNSRSLTGQAVEGLGLATWGILTNKDKDEPSHLGAIFRRLEVSKRMGLLVRAVGELMKVPAWFLAGMVDVANAFVKNAFAVPESPIELFRWQHRQMAIILGVMPDQVAEHPDLVLGDAKTPLAAEL